MKTQDELEALDLLTAHCGPAEQTVRKVIEVLLTTVELRVHRGDPMTPCATEWDAFITATQAAVKTLWGEIPEEIILAEMARATDGYGSTLERRFERILQTEPSRWEKEDGRLNRLLAELRRVPEAGPLRSDHELSRANARYCEETARYWAEFVFEKCSPEQWEAINHEPAKLVSA